MGTCGSNNKKTKVYQVSPERRQKSIDEIQRLYQLSTQKRQVLEEFQDFVGEIDQSVQENFGEELARELRGYRRIRGDGNCFYTSFIYQLLELSLASKELSSWLDKSILQCDFRLQFAGAELEEQDGMRCEFLMRIRDIRQEKKSSANRLFLEFKNSSDVFYGLSIIFIKNLICDLYFTDEEVRGIATAMEIPLEKELIEWERECSMNEAIISMLSRKLPFYIVIYCLEDQLRIQKYGNPKNLCISLIYSPGHYSIAIPK